MSRPTSLLRLLAALSLLLTAAGMALAQEPAAPASPDARVETALKGAQLGFLIDEGDYRLDYKVDEVAAQRLPPAAHLRRLVEAFMVEYEHSAARHRVLVQDVKYLERAHRARVLARQRRVVDGFAAAIAPLAPEAARAELAKPLTMILFGMINWTFTWLKDRGPLTYSGMAPLVADLFLGGIGRVRLGEAPSTRPRGRRVAGTPSLKAIA